MNRAKELADDIRNHGYSGNPTHAQEVATLLSRLAAIDSATSDEVEAVRKRHESCILRTYPVYDIKAVDVLSDVAEWADKNRATLLAIVQRQEYEALESCGAHEAKDLALSRAKANLARLTERLRTMQHGETEALKMMGAEKRRADEMTAQLETEQAEFAEFRRRLIRALKPVGIESGLLDIELAAVRTQELAAAKAEAAQLRKIISDSVNALGNHSAASPDCTLDFMSRVPDEIRHAVKKLRDLAETLAKGISAYRWKSESVAAAWENDYGHTVPR